MKLIQENPKLAAGAALIVMMLALTSMFRKDKVPEEVVTTANAHFDHLARQAAAAAAELPDGADLVVMALKSEADLPSTKKGYRRIYRALKSEGASIKHIELLVRDTTKGWYDMIMGYDAERVIGIPYEEFLRVAREQPDADAIVSLYGAPYFSKTTERPDPASLPALVVTRVSALTPRLEKLVDEGRVAVAVVAEGTAPADSPNAAFKVLTSPRR